MPIDNVNEIIDKFGNVRRNGSWNNRPGIVSSKRLFEDAHPMYTDDQIKTIISDPNRQASRITFDKTWILNQGQFGSCCPTATAGALSRAMFRRGLAKLLLSGAYLYSKINGGRDSGSALEDALDAVQQFGIAPLSVVPPTEIYPRLQPQNADTEAAKHKALVAFPVATLGGLRSALAAFMPCITALQAGNNFQNLNADGVCGVDAGSGDHSVGTDDIKFVNGVWLYDMFNSWDTTFGQDGRGYLTNNHFASTFGTNTFFAIASTEEQSEES